MPIDFLKMFINTGIPFDKYLVQTLRTQSKCHVGTIKYEATAVYADRTTVKLTNNGGFCIRSMYIGHSAGIAGIVEHL